MTANRTFIARVLDLEPARLVTLCQVRSALISGPACSIAFVKAASAHATWTGGDTCLEEECFFSYRRSVLRHEPDYGRQISVICLA